MPSSKKSRDASPKRKSAVKTAAGKKAKAATKKPKASTPRPHSPAKKSKAMPKSGKKPKQTPRKPVHSPARKTKAAPKSGKKPKAPIVPRAPKSGTSSLDDPNFGHRLFTVLVAADNPAALFKDIHKSMEQHYGS